MKSKTLSKQLAITFTGGMDSTVLAYDICSRLEGFKADEVTLLVCDYGQASFKPSYELITYHTREIRKRYHIDVEFQVLVAQLPNWVGKDAGLFKEGYVPSTPSDVIDYSRESRSYDDELVDGRNGFLFLYMLSYCSKNEIPILYTGHQREPSEWANCDAYRHRTEDFGPEFIARMNLLQEVGFRNRVHIAAPFLDYRLSKLDIIRLGKRLNVDLDKTYSCQYYPACGKCDNCTQREWSFKEYLDGQR